ncbi:MAG: DUF4147 domain-containing protein, partial [Alphaproteobacteria bacterium]
MSTGNDGVEGVLRALFDAAVGAVDPAVCVPPHLKGVSLPVGRTIAVGAGKASAAMAKAMEDHWPGAVSGLVVTRYGHGCACRDIEIIEAAHPVPDTASLDAGTRILALAQDLREDDLLVGLFSGGASSLMALPAPGLSLRDKQAVHRALLASGAPITEINKVRRHLSAIKGGHLAAAAAPARVLSLMISDVPGDDPSVISGGPTVADPTTFADARAVLAKYAIRAPEAVQAHLAGGAIETLKPGDAALAATETIVVGAPGMALEAAVAEATRQGLDAVNLGDRIEGEAREVAKTMAAMALARPRHGPAVLISGGETTVTVKGQGRGGRNTEFLLALALALDGAPGIWAIACDT